MCHMGRPSIAETYSFTTATPHQPDPIDETLTQTTTKEPKPEIEFSVKNDQIIYAPTESAPFSDNRK